MSRRRPPIPVILVLPPESPTPDEIDAVLMATDAIVMQAGRAGVTLTPRFEVAEISHLQAVRNHTRQRR